MPVSGTSTLRNLSIFCLMCSYTLVYSQGYLGRKIILKYDILTSSSTSNPTYNSPIGVTNRNYSNRNNEGEKNPFIGINTINCLAFEYLIDRTSSVTLYGGYGRTSVIHQIGYRNKNYNTTYLYDPYDINIKLFTNEVGLKYTTYTSNASVGLGLYFSISFSGMFNVIKEQLDIDEEINIRNLHAFNNSTVGFELGYQKIYYDRITTSLAVVSRLHSFTLMNIYRGNRHNSNSSNNDIYINPDNPFEHYQREMDRLEYNAKRRIFLRDIIMIKYSVGFLIF